MKEYKISKELLEVLEEIGDMSPYRILIVSKKDEVVIVVGYATAKRSIIYISSKQNERFYGKETVNPKETLDETFRVLIRSSKSANYETKFFDTENLSAKELFNFFLKTEPFATTLRENPTALKELKEMLT